tara:strand:- start:589 stop:798 length:210 start_codon:yes stop_codon:yes gene_type:complete
MKTYIVQKTVTLIMEETIEASSKAEAKRRARDWFGFDMTDAQYNATFKVLGETQTNTPIEGEIDSTFNV